MASVTRRTGTRGSDRRAAVGDKLQQAMERLLEKRVSFTQVSVELLASEAGISRATFYLHFRDKGELVARLMASVTADVVQAATLDEPEQVTRADLRKSVKAVVALHRRHYAVMAAIIETAAYDEQVEALFQDMMERLIEVNRGAIRHLKQAGRLSASVPLQVAETITWGFERSCHQMLRQASTAQVKALVDALTHVIWNSVYAVPQGR